MKKENKKRVTCHNARFGKNGVFNVNHNDRNFCYERSDHINAEKTEQNIFFINPELDNPDFESAGTFESLEKMVYEYLFSDFVKHRNERYLEQWHPEKCGTVDDLRKSRFYCPEEKIYQIGKREDSIDAFTLSDIIKETQLRVCNKFPELENHCLWLDIAFHLDENSIHAHLRQVWFYRDENGDLRPGQDRALRDMGVPLPDPSKKKGRYNNRKVTFDKISREIYLEVCKDYGLEIEEEPIKGVHHQEKEAYIRSEIEKEEAELQDLQERLSDVDCDERTEEIKLEFIQAQVEMGNEKLAEIKMESEKMTDKARRDAEDIVNAAVIDAESIRKEAKNEQKKIRENISRLQRQMQEQINRMTDENRIMAAVRLQAILDVLSECEMSDEDGQKINALEYYEPFIERKLNDIEWLTKYLEDSYKSDSISEYEQGDLLTDINAVIL